MLRKTYMFAFLSAIALFGCAGTANAIPLALYEANANANDNTFLGAPYQSSDTEPLTTATDLSQGGGLTGGGAGSFVISNNWNGAAAPDPRIYNLGSVNGVDQAAASAGGDYIEFTLQTNGNQVLFENLTFFTNQNNTGAQVDISQTIGAGPELFILTGFTPTTGNSSTVPLTTVDFADFLSTDNVRYRFYLYGAGSSGPATRFDDITLNGTIVPQTLVPEPATATLGLLSIGGLLVRRRQKA